MQDFICRELKSSESFPTTLIGKSPCPLSFGRISVYWPFGYDSKGTFFEICIIFISIYIYFMYFCSVWIQYEAELIWINTHINLTNKSPACKDKISAKRKANDIKEKVLCLQRNCSTYYFLALISEIISFTLR